MNMIIIIFLWKYEAKEGMDLLQGVFINYSILYIFI